MWSMCNYSLILFLYIKYVCFNFPNYLFCQLIHALSPALRRQWPKISDWRGISIDYEICSRQTRSEVKEKCRKKIHLVTQNLSPPLTKQPLGTHHAVVTSKETRISALFILVYELHIRLVWIFSGVCTLDSFQLHHLLTQKLPTWTSYEGRKKLRSKCSR
jgi:hypothetical protein